LVGCSASNFAGSAKGVADAMIKARTPARLFVGFSVS
jgi:hypothetical protein